MAKSMLAVEMDAVQLCIDPVLRQFGFRKHGRVYNKKTEDGLVQVVGFQMGPFDPPGTVYVPGLTASLYGRFTVNLGIHIPEVARHHMRTEPKSVIRDYHCSIRTRLGRTSLDEPWWLVAGGRPVVEDLTRLLQSGALPFFKTFGSRDQILAAFLSETENTSLIDVPRIVCAIILYVRGDSEGAKTLLSAQVRESATNPHHPSYVIELAGRLGIELVP